jgi:hypothetical protein
MILVHRKQLDFVRKKKLLIIGLCCEQGGEDFHQFINCFRFLPEPDLPVLNITADDIKVLTDSMPMLPAQLEKQLQVCR